MQNIEHEKGNITQSSLNECIMLENLSSKCVVKKKGTSPQQEREDFGVETYLPKKIVKLNTKKT